MAKQTSSTANVKYMRARAGLTELTQRGIKLEKPRWKVRGPRDLTWEFHFPGVDQTLGLGRLCINSPGTLIKTK